MSQPTPLTRPRLHIGLEVRDLPSAAAFYETLLGVTPSKEKPGYRKFEADAPSVNLSLTENKAARPAAVAGSGHFGVQVTSTSDVQAAIGRLTEAGYEARPEDRVTCCYAVQDKVWTRDPDGNLWEVFVVLSDAETFLQAPKGEERTCCAPDCCS